jgi:tetratricopeptide (TPR) repeat protein
VPPCYSGVPGYPACGPERRHLASLLVDAFACLGEFANDPNAPLRTYPQRAEAWRALSVKPAVPEEVRVRRLLAEDAVKAKNPEEALAHYELGLELYPTWPQGYFNAALIAAELGYFAQAVEHMQAYVDLVPDAADAPAARDQIAIWKFKAK